jgi:dipeptidase D
MNQTLESIKPSLLWKHFAQILRIPHCSGSEKALGDYIVSVAKGLNLASKRDKVGNVVVLKPASLGRENSAKIILQGHLDMVCEKNSDVVHDFNKDPIQAEIKGEWVQAKGTTLGSDNGIGVASALAVMEDKSLVHGPMEFLFTIDEEVGLKGAYQLRKDFLSGTQLFNLDSEELGTFTIGCSGGGDSEITLPLERKKRKSKDLYRLKVFGFRGGHSGIDINQGRGNAIRLLARLLYILQEKSKFELVSVEGGNKRNAIPREAWALLYLERTMAKKIYGILKDQFAKVQNEYKAVEREAQLSFEKMEGSKDDPLTAASQGSLIRFLLSLPHGVIAMHPEIAGLVETSTNLAIIRCEENEAQIITSSRSSVGSALEAVRKSIQALAELAGARIVHALAYPGWEPDLQSELLKKLTEVYKKVFSKDPLVKAIHAGLECGIIGKKYPGMDMISFGPTIEHPHSPEERVHIGSVENFWRFLTTSLQDLV